MKLVRSLPALVVALCFTTPVLAAPDGFLGVYLTEDDKGQNGALVEDVAPESPAWDKGVRKGDRVVSCNGQATPNSNAFIAHLAKASAGDTLALEVIRDGWKKAVSIQLGTRARIATSAPKAETRVTPPKERGFLGVYLRQGPEGQAIVDGVMRDSPAAKGGLKVGDAVRTVDGKAISDPSSFIAAVGQHAPDATIKVEVSRGAERLTLSVTLGRRPSEADAPPPAAEGTKPAPAPAAEPGGRKKPFIGIALVDMSGKGPLKVDDVQANSPAERYGLRTGDVIISVNDKATTTTEDFVNVMGGLYAGDAVLFKIERDGWRSDIRFTLEAKE